MAYLFYNWRFVPVNGLHSGNLKTKTKRDSQIQRLRTLRFICRSTACCAIFCHYIGARTRLKCAREADSITVYFDHWHSEASGPSPGPEIHSFFFFFFPRQFFIFCCLLIVKICYCSSNNRTQVYGLDCFSPHHNNKLYIIFFIMTNST